MRVYHGRMTEQGGAITVEEGTTLRALDPRFDLRTHSPTGFSWGYLGSGPAQLSLALAADVLGNDDRAEAIYQDLKFKLVARLPEDEWFLTEDEIRSTIEQLEHAQTRRRG